MLLAFSPCLWLCPKATAQALPIAGDLITFQGGAESADNPDMYVIDMGNYVFGQEYQVVFNRPNGVEANYSVSLPFTTYDNEFKFTSTGYEDNFGASLEFAAGETTKTIKITPDMDFFGENLRGAKGYFYLLFGNGNRTNAQYPVLKLVWTNTATPAPANTPNEYFNSVDFTQSDIGSYGVFSFDYRDKADLTIQNDTRLRIDRKYIDHAAQAVSGDDAATAVNQTLYLSAEQELGEQTAKPFFLYKMTEEAVLTQYYSEEYEGRLPAVFTQRADTVIGVHYADGSKDTTIYGGNEYNPPFLLVIQGGYHYMDIPPRFGTVAADKSSYDIGETLTLTISIPNSRLLQKIYGAAWLDMIDLTLDGGQTFINHGTFSFNAANNTLTIVAKAANTTGNATTVAAEVYYRKKNNDPTFLPDKSYYPYGAYTTFTVTTATAPFAELTSLDFTMPAENRVALDFDIDPNYADYEYLGDDEWGAPIYNVVKKVKLLHTVNTNATFHSGVWTSSDDAIATVLADGTLVARRHGKVTLTFISDEVAYRTENGLPANDALLVRSFDIYVMGPTPYIRIFGQRPYDESMYYDTYFSLDHNLKDNSWHIDGEVETEFIHSDSAKYHSYKDAFEVTSEMIDGDGWGFVALKYPLPFDEITFPRLPTMVDSTSLGMGDKIVAPPYKLVMSMPLKQTIGDYVMTTVLTDTFLMHLEKPFQPVIRIVEETMPGGLIQPGDSVSFKYEIKYLDKYKSPVPVYNPFYPNIGGFQLDYGIWYNSYYSDFTNSQYDLPWTEYTYRTDQYTDISNLPEGLTLTDEGGWYNATLTLKYVMPAPTGEGTSGMEYFACRLYGGNIANRTMTINEYRPLDTYTGDIDEPNSKVLYYNGYARESHPMNEWEENGLQLSQMLSLLNDANTNTHNYAAFNAYFDEQHSNVRTLYNTPEIENIWGEMHVGVSGTETNDTIWNDPRQTQTMVSVPCNKDADYSITVRYPKMKWQQTYPIHADSIAGAFYSMNFWHNRSKSASAFMTTFLNPSAPVTLSYMRGDSVQVDTAVTMVAQQSFEPCYILYEPKGIIGDVSFMQGQIKGSANLKPLDYYMPKTASFETGYGLYTQSRYYRNDCLYSISDLPMKVIDVETGQPIAANKNLHVNYIRGRSRRLDLSGSQTAATVYANADGTFSVPIDGLTGTYMLLEVVADGYTPVMVDANIVSDRNTIIPLRPASNKAKYFSSRVGTKGGGIMDATNYYHYSYTDLSKNGLNSIHSILKPVSIIIEAGIVVQNDWNLNNLKLRNGKNAMQISPRPVNSGFDSNGIMNSTIDNPSTFHNLSDFGFENDYAVLQYDNISLENSSSFFAPQLIYYPEIYYTNTGTVVTKIPGIRNNSDWNAQEVATNISTEVKSQVIQQFSPGKFDKDGFGDVGNMNKAMDGIKGISFDLPDPLPFSIETRYEGNRMYIMGVMAHNFVNDLPIVGQINMAGGYMARIDEMTKAIESIKSVVQKSKSQSKMRNFTQNVNIFGGIKGYIEGYGEMNSSTGSYNWGLNEGGLFAEISGGAGVWINGGFVRVKTQISGLASFGMGISKPEDSDLARAINMAKFDMWLESKLSLDVYAEASGGIDLYIASAKVGVYAGGGFENRNKVIFRPYLPPSDSRYTQAGGYFNVHAYMYAFAKAHFLFWSWGKEWKVFDAEKTWYYPNNSNNPYKSPALRSLKSVYQRSAAQLPGGIITDVASNANPMYMSDGNSLLFNNLKDPQIDNDDRIMIYSSGSQTDLIPTAILPAFGFDAAHSATNNVSVVAYEQLADSIRPISENVSENTYIKTQAANSDIYAAVKTGAGSWTTTKISDVSIDVETEPTDMQPKTAISSDGQTAAVVWRSGIAKADDTGVKVSGGLYLSRYKDAAWQLPVYLANADLIGDYVAAIDGDSVVIAATRLEQVVNADNPQQMDAISRIRLISVDKDNVVTFNETGMKGRHPQIKAAGSNYYVSFVGEKQLNDTVSASDIYLMPVSRGGQLLHNLPFGFAGMEEKVAFGFKLAATPNANSISDLAVVYNAARIEGEGTMKHNLVASKFGVQDGVIYASAPTTVLSVEADSTQMITDYDVYKSGNMLKTAATVSNVDFGAIIIEGSATFENKIACIYEEYNPANLKAGKELDIDFYVQNNGMQPLTALTVTIGGVDTQHALSILPGYETVANGVYTMPEGATEADSASYSIVGTFADGTTHNISGKMDLTQYQINVSLVSLNNGETSNMAVVDVINNSESPLTSQHQVAVGVYEDLLGETLAQGTTLQMFPASDFYGDNGNGMLINKQKSVSFQIPNVEEATTFFAIAKVRKINPQPVGILRSPSEIYDNSEELAQRNKSYAPIQLFPTSTCEPLTHNFTDAADMQWTLATVPLATFEKSDLKYPSNDPQVAFRILDNAPTNGKYKWVAAPTYFEAGQGFAYSANGTPTALSFDDCAVTGAVNSPALSTGKYTVAGNPYNKLLSITNISIDSYALSFYTTNAAGKTFPAKVEALQPFEARIVGVGAGNTIGSSNTVDFIEPTASPAPALTSSPLMKITSTNDNGDTYWTYIEGNATYDWEQFAADECEVIQLYTVKEGNDIALYALNQEESIEIPLVVFTTYNGDATLTFTGMDTFSCTIELIDNNITGQIINLSGLASVEYPTTITGSAADRFAIAINRVPTDAQNNAANVYAYSVDSQINIVSSKIIGSVAIYSIDGKAIFTTDNVNETHYVTDILPAGAYFVKANGNVQKVIVK
ncbi:MAG: hypothetical protein LBS01_04330 [Prevotellaceae bacterium]|nr:hypothetical protein [Prevotellaceae bacterium]